MDFTEHLEQSPTSFRVAMAERGIEIDALVAKAEPAVISTLISKATPMTIMKHGKHIMMRVFVVHLHLKVTGLISLSLTKSLMFANLWRKLITNTSHRS